MNKTTKKVMLSGMAAVMLMSCGTAKKSGQSDAGQVIMGNMEEIDSDYLILDDSQRNLLTKNNTFALNLFNKVSGMDSKVVSPLSVTGLMSILANGAEGETRQEILNILGWNGASMDEINALYGYLIKKAGKLDPSTTVSIADYIAVNKNNKVKKDFERTVSDWFKAEVENLDFTSNKTTDIINDWCSRHTDGMIPKIIDNVEPSAV
ncbi:MAG TPA: serpin family protein, partial [Rikenellaceae bacterium]|nr:serpin family protein [Rikenellaceae bacterium]